MHGLGVDPADGAVYAAGHLGVFRLTGAEAVRVADRYQDTMGFTVTGPGTFLASGHPSPTDRTAASPHLGLIRSTDAARTWRTVSAEGEADFHALQRAGGTLYGFDSQTSQVWASTNEGRTWDRRARLPASDLAAHADAPQEIWATTPDGPVISSDGGRTFRPVSRAPDLAAIERPAPDTLVALGADGTILNSRDGRAWKARGRLPLSQEAKPTVLTAVSPTHLLAADSGDTVYESQNGGRSWRVLHRPTGQSGDIH
ncbi:F510_1955 family glycosylhydrolase [Streptomyces sp. H27-C3]|uniref:F510_1955 family glycosylhydrolase n=1 Tax=Streptomyces sp. H27-C3 TaxID=3046305 RepID=UPI0024B89F00|nr:exo-alpha-sialidase [Streptomyces sp. H27-C3]MDJ0464101.1 exo-alpha-sialidase [Streptomyces sp. H27-C3]